MKRLAILGASGHGKVVADCAECAGWGEIVFFDDEWPKCSVNGKWDVTGDTNALIKDNTQYDGVIVAIGNNEIRIEKQHELQKRNVNFVSIIHPSSLISKYVEIGIGSVVMAGSIVNIDTSLGDGCIVNTGSSIDHDCVIGDGVHISPGAHLAGGVVVGDCSWIGIGSSVREQIKIGERTVVGAGSVVIKNLPATAIAYGNPAIVIN